MDMTVSLKKIKKMYELLRGSPALTSTMYLKHKGFTQDPVFTF